MSMPDIIEPFDMADFRARLINDLRSIRDATSTNATAQAIEWYRSAVTPNPTRSELTRLRAAEKLIAAAGRLAAASIRIDAAIEEIEDPDAADLEDLLIIAADAIKDE